MGVFLILCLFNFSLCFLTKLWSLPTLAVRIALVSNTEVLCCRDTNTWSIWFCVDPSGDVHVYLCLMRWGSIFPVVIRLLEAANLAILSPFSFIVPIPCSLITFSHSSFDSPTLALRSSSRVWVPWNSFDMCNWCTRTSDVQLWMKKKSLKGSMWRPG